MTLDEFIKKWGRSGASLIIKQAADRLDDNRPVDEEHKTELRDISRDLRALLMTAGA